MFILNERDVQIADCPRICPLYIIFFHTLKKKDHQSHCIANSLKPTMESFATKFLDEAFADNFLPSCGPSSGTQSSLYSQVFGAYDTSKKIVNDRDDVNSTRRNASGNHRGSDKPSTRRSVSGNHRGSEKESTLSKFMRQIRLRGGHQRSDVLRRGGGHSAGIRSGSRAGLPSGL
jgi:hypothetical protein